jgi:hypothetical protein
MDRMAGVFIKFPWVFYRAREGKYNVPGSAAKLSDFALKIPEQPFFSPGNGRGRHPGDIQGVYF